MHTVYGLAVSIALQKKVAVTGCSCINMARTIIFAPAEKCCKICLVFPAGGEPGACWRKIISIYLHTFGKNIIARIEGPSINSTPSHHHGFRELDPTSARSKKEETVRSRNGRSRPHSAFYVSCLKSHFSMSSEHFWGWGGIHQDDLDTKSFLALLQQLVSCVTFLESLCEEESSWFTASRSTLLHHQAHLSHAVMHRDIIIGHWGLSKCNFFLIVFENIGRKSPCSADQWQRTSHNALRMEWGVMEPASCCSLLHFWNFFLFFSENMKKRWRGTKSKSITMIKIWKDSVETRVLLMQSSNQNRH